LVDFEVSPDSNANVCTINVSNDEKVRPGGTSP